VTLHGDNTFSLRQAKYKVSEALKTGEASVLFGGCMITLQLTHPNLNACWYADYLADSVDAFLTESNSVVSDQSEELYLGFTFSFPVEQSAIDKGVLLTCESCASVLM
jgi:hexokinase